MVWSKMNEMKKYLLLFMVISAVFPINAQVDSWDPDWDGDNNVGVSDLLGLLSVFGDYDLDNDGIWDSVDDCVGEYDECGVCNGEGIPEGFCTCELAIDAVGECGGHCISDNNDDGVCDEYAIFLEAEEISSSEFGTTYRVYVNFSGPGYTLGWIGGDNEEGIPSVVVQSTLDFYQNEYGAFLGHLINPAFYVLFPELEIDSWLTVGAQPGDESGPWFLGLDWEEFENGNGIENVPGGVQFTSFEDAQPYSSDSSGRVLVAQLTTAGTVTFNTSIGYWDDNGNLLESDLEQIEFGN